MPTLLINEQPIELSPSLINVVGLEGAVVIQQLHTWLENPKIGETHDDRKWVRNSLREWSTHFLPFWKPSKISRIILKLERDGFIVSRADINDRVEDRTKWYTINYTQLEVTQ